MKRKMRTMGWLVPVLFFAWIVLALSVLPERPDFTTLPIWRPQHPQVAIVAGIVGIVGVYLRYQFPSPDGWILGFLVDLAPELVGMAFTVVVIDELNQRRLDQQEKDRLFAQVKSLVRDAALEALRLIQEKHWLNEMLKKYDHDLSSVQWQGADLEDTNLKGVNLRNANLKGVNLRSANLREANLSSANLEGANLSSAKLEKVSLRNANLKGASLFGASLKGANLLGSSLRQADLSWANLEGAILRVANLEGSIVFIANMQGNYLVDAYLEGTTYTAQTTWPETFDPKTVGAIKGIIDNETFAWVPIRDQE